MRDVAAGTLGVLGTILVAAGLGIVGVTAASRLMPSRTAIRWAHLVLGIGLLGLGVTLLGLDVTFFGVV